MATTETIRKLPALPARGLVRRLVRGLGLAATPTFGLMAWFGTGSAGFCLAEPGPLPLDGMSRMYLLMSLFHATPWLKLMAGSSLHLTPNHQIRQTETDHAKYHRIP